MIEASCHCGAVRVQVTRAPQEVEVKECNCSICRRTGAVLAYIVARRTREIGVRVALGASARRVITSIFRRPLTQVSLGSERSQMDGVLAVNDWLEDYDVHLAVTEPAAYVSSSGRPT